MLQDRASVGATLDVEAQIDIARHVLPTQFLTRAIEVLKRRPPPCVVLSPQVIVLLGIRLMAVSSDDAPDLQVDDLGRRLGGLCLAFGDHIDQGPLNEKTTILEMLRLQLFYGQSQHPGWLSLAGRLFFDVLPRLTEHPAWCDPLNRFHSGTGLTLERFWAISSVEGTAASHSADHFQFPVNIEEHPISAEDLDCWRAVMATSIADAVDAARFDMSRPLAWSMTSVWKRPVIDFGSGRGPVLRPWLLDMQTEPQQMFWHVRDVVVGQGVPHQRWSDLYGKAVEILGLELLSEHVDADEVLTETEFVERWSIPSKSKKADAAIVTASGDLVVVDFVSRQFTRDTTTTGDFDALSKDLKIGVIEKLKQVDVTLTHAIAAGDGSQRIFPIVVLAGPFPMFPPLDTAVNDGLSELGVSVIGVHSDCRPWVALDLLNWMLLLRVSTLTGTSVPELLDDWQKSSLARNAFREWALRDGPGSGLPGGGLPDDWQARVNGYLGFSMFADDKFA